MGEKIDYKVLRPMKGHSRGEWYASVDDIAESDSEAKFWAIFGVTPRGNMRCLGEFATKEAADKALKEMNIGPK